jgi:hypothetical protein
MGKVKVGRANRELLSVIRVSEVMNLARRIYRVLNFFTIYCIVLAFIFIAFLAMATKFFVLYCILPVFIFFTVFTVAVRERDRNFRVGEIIRSLFRKIF